MASRGRPFLERDPRSLRVQIEEDDDVIELETDVDTGAGVTTFYDSDNETSARTTCYPGPGKGRGSGKLDYRFPDEFDASLYQDDQEIPRGNDDEEVAPQTLTATRARMVAGKGRGSDSVTTTPLRVSQFRSDEHVATTPLRTSQYRSDELLLNCTPSTPDEQQQFDDDNCPATREEFRNMRRQLKEARLVVNELLQKTAGIRTVLGHENPTASCATNESNNQRPVRGDEVGDNWQVQIA